MRHIPIDKTDILRQAPISVCGARAISEGECVDMAVFRARVSIRDTALHGDEDYSQNFHISESGTSDQAWEDANEIAEALAGILLPESATVYAVSIHNADVVNGVQTRLVSIPGTRVVTGDPLPAWNVARMQFRADAGNRPSTFYLRMGLTEDDVTGQTLASATQTLLDDFRTAFLAQGHVCNPSGGLFTIGSFDEFVHMRQMGWHRRTRVGYHRGWVPNT